MSDSHQVEAGRELMGLTDRELAEIEARLSRRYLQYGDTRPDIRSTLQMMADVRDLLAEVRRLRVQNGTDAG